MTKFPEALWLNVSPSFQKFDRPLLKNLSKQVNISQWEYSQTPDEPASLEVAITLLHDYLKKADRPIHLLGHSTAGLLALLYARRYPERVKSLTLLSVGVYPAVDWQAHYYVHYQLLPCSRNTRLTQMVYNLFGYQSKPVAKNLIKTLERDLENSLSPHTLFRRVSIAPQEVLVPLLVCGAQDDMIIDPQQRQGWERWLKPKDRLWQCPNGRYFFHYFQTQLVTEQILNFWSCFDAGEPSQHNLKSFHF